MNLRRIGLLLVRVVGCQPREARGPAVSWSFATPHYTVAFASFGPLDALVFVARADGASLDRS